MALSEKHKNMIRAQLSALNVRFRGRYWV